MPVDTNAKLPTSQIFIINKYLKVSSAKQNQKNKIYGKSLLSKQMSVGCR